MSRVVTHEPRYPSRSGTCIIPPGWPECPDVGSGGYVFPLASRILHRYTGAMPDGPRLSLTSALILQGLAAGYIYGYTVMELTGLPSGTVYPALRRLESDRLIRSQWERQSIADAELRPPRKYYRLTRSGEAALEASRKRYPLLAKLLSKEEVRDL